MSYVKTQWNNDAPPAINAENLNKMEQGIYDAHENKVDKVDGKGLSTNDFTNPLKNKLENGVAVLDESGKVPSSQLPSYVDDVVEYASRQAFPATGETGKIYVAKDTNICYRWGGTEYVEISSSLALGETSSTAYRGDRGKAAYDHTQNGDVHVTTSQKDEWTAKYDKPETGIPASDLEEEYYTESEIDDLLDNKVDKVDGKGLSTNDYDDTEKGKVASALQPSALTPYRTSEAQDVIDAGKQNVIDLSIVNGKLCVTYEEV